MGLGKRSLQKFLVAKFVFFVFLYDTFRSKYTVCMYVVHNAAPKDIIVKEIIF